MTSIRYSTDTTNQFDDNTNIEGAPITAYMGVRSKAVDLIKGAIGVAPVGKTPDRGTTIPTTDFVLESASVTNLAALVQFFCVLQMARTGSKFTQPSFETKECTILFNGMRNVRVHSDIVSKAIPLREMMYLYPSPVDKKVTAQANMWEFLAVDFATLQTKYNKDNLSTTGVSLENLASRWVIGPAPRGKPAGFTNLPIEIGSVVF